MVTFCIVAYLVAGVLTARNVWIGETRSWEKAKAENTLPRGDCDTYCRTYPRGCSKCYHRGGSPTRGGHIIAPLSIIIWPVLLTLYGIVVVCENTGKVLKWIGHSPPVNMAIRGWLWFWQDPKERKRI